MLAIIPLLALIAILFASYNLQNIYRCWRHSFLISLIIWGTIVTVITELLSLFSSLTFLWVTAMWVVVVMIALIVCFKTRIVARFAIAQISRQDLLLLSAVLFIVAVTLLIALMSPPNTADSLAYHLARVEHWIQNQNVFHYPTHIIRQIYLPPWAEFAIMHLQLLSGGDQFANLIQWFSMVGTLIGISLIARQLGAGISGQVLSVVLCCTIPMGILQASSTQNDYVVTLWLALLVYCLMLLYKHPTWHYSLATGMVLGLAILTKGTTYVYALPFLLWFGIYGARKLGWNLWRPVLLVATITLVLNIGHCIRNIDLFGHPLADAASMEKHANAEITVPLLVSNIVRNIGLHLGTPFWSLNIATYNGIKIIHKLLDVELNDPRITWPGGDFTIPWLKLHESFAGNLLHLFFIALAIVVFCIARKKESTYYLRNYALSIIAASLLLAVGTRFQVWASRLHLPLFVLWCPFVAIILTKMPNPLRGNKKLSVAICLVILCAITGVVLYYSFGTKVITEMYHGKSCEFLNSILQKRDSHSLNHYLQKGDTILGEFLILIGSLVIIAVFLYFINWQLSFSCALICIFTSLPWLFANSTRSLIGPYSIWQMKRSDLYFGGNAALRDSYTLAANYIKSKKYLNIGIARFGEAGWDYLWFVLLKENNRAVRIEHVNVINTTAEKYANPYFAAFIPDVIISLSTRARAIVYGDIIYTRTRSFNHAGIFVRN